MLLILDKNEEMRFLIYLISLISINCWSESEKKAKFQFSSVQKGQGVVLRIGINKGFHFNEQAPIEIKNLKSNSPKESITHRGKLELRFLLIPSNSSTYSITFFICDDSNTICRKEEILGYWDAESSQFRSKKP